MQLESFGDNVHVVTFDSGTKVLFSYQTPVAVHKQGDKVTFINKEYYPAKGPHRTVTTSKHISRFAGRWACHWKEIEPARIDRFVQSGE